MKITKSMLKDLIKEQLNIKNEAMPSVNVPKLQDLRSISDPMEKLESLKKIIDNAIKTVPSDTAMFLAKNIAEFLNI